MSTLKAIWKRTEDLEAKKARLQENSWHLVEEMESSLHDLRQKHEEKAKGHSLTLNAIFTAYDKALKDLDELEDSLQLEASIVKERQMQAF